MNSLAILFSHFRLWLVYGMTEAFCLVVLYWVRYGNTNMGQSWWITAALTLAVYPLIGLFFGALHRLAFRFFPHGKSTLGHETLVSSGSAWAAALIGGLFLLNALIRRQYYAIPGSLLVLASAFCRWKNSGRQPVLSRFSRWLPMAGTVCLMVLWAFIFEPRANVSLRLMIGTSLLALFGVAAAVWLLGAIRKRLPAKWLEWGKPSWPLLGAVWLLAVGFAVSLLGFYPRNDLDVPGDVLPVAQADNRAPQPAHVLLITLDTVRASHMSVYGYPRPTTPFLEQFAAGAATLYTRAYSASNGTLSSHAAIFTGLHSSATGAYSDASHPAGSPIRSDLPLLAEMLKKAGYATLGFVANYGYLAKFYGFGRGFDRYFSQSDGFISEHQQFFQETIRELLRNWLGNNVCRMYYDAPKINRFLKKSKAFDTKRPTFLFVNYMDAHWPYVPRAEFSRQFNEAEVEIQWGKPGLYQERLTAGISIGTELAYLRNQYDAAICQLDQALEELVALLKERGEFDRTLIVITSDHGEALGENGLLMHGLGVKDDQVWVPLIIKYPFQEKGKIDDRPTGGVDILPTILAALGLAGPRDCHGRNLMAASPAIDALPVIVESFTKTNTEANRAADQDSPEEARFVFDTRQVYWNAGRKKIFSSGNGGEIADDPNRQGFLRLVDSYLKQTAVWMRRKQEEGALAAMQRRLRTLGYL